MEGVVLLIFGGAYPVTRVVSIGRVISEELRRSRRVHREHQCTVLWKGNLTDQGSFRHQVRRDQSPSDRVEGDSEELATEHGRDEVS